MKLATHVGDHQADFFPWVKANLLNCVPDIAVGKLIPHLACFEEFQNLLVAAGVQYDRTVELQSEDGRHGSE